VTPSNAIYYSFYDTPWLEPMMSSPPFSLSPTSMIGADAAFTHLMNRKCTLATKAWVNNHWGLILWKLAGMVALEPEREKLKNEKRWCWREVFTQLLYRQASAVQGCICILT
jgi:breast cancer 2 susceptibility protein